ncbi:YbaB/EbfC family nucleoid-associated protein [Streptomyces zingiberis]|uniref:YbaB/EbfC family nucleoid-associated protein n=1 Tax=Streptomyces zingiberis TaxID=2053010 RepID=A0ABX1C4B3_9ACTN|nr:YbaB/EbfC family nucleoid-associated protein [Streptomyces zingiberis]NJQ02995.1 YbaB/EbfC family nucleoid-associated protein [Streptomyces zingiberis]
MSDSIEDRLAKAVAHLEATKQAAARAQEQLSQASVTVRSRDRSVEVTVNAQGGLGEVKFLDGKYRTMGAAQLSASVMEATRQAQAEMARTVMETFRPLSETEGDRPYIEGSGIDWDDLFGPLMATVEEAETGRPSASDKLRDEIIEDGDSGNGAGTYGQKGAGR